MVMEDTVVEENGVQRMEVEQPAKDDKAARESAEQCEPFKKPILVGSRQALKAKSLLHSYKQQKLLIEQQAVNKEEPVPEESKDNLVAPTAITVTDSKPAFPYTEPPWSGLPEKNYSLEELKSGIIERTVNLKEKPFFVFGRLETCHISMAHPTVSRYHAVLQFRAIEENDQSKGFYLYDLGSTHGTFLNKSRLKPQVYARVKVGHMFKIGCSTRLFILQGPTEDEEEESEFTVTELKEQRRIKIEEEQRKEEEIKLQEKLEEERRQKLLEEKGIDWGMGEDADEETDLSENPFAVTTNEELYIDDPKKTLRGWFEREGEELTYDIEQAEKGLFVCKIVLPLDSGTGRDVVVEISAKSKKEAMVQCALEACRYIDRQGLLRQAHHESRKRQTKNWEENDYYDSDEDNFLDRTGQIEKKREKRMRKYGKIQDTVETYESLMEKHQIVVDKLQNAENKLNSLMSGTKVKEVQPNEDSDALDEFMKNLTNKRPDKLEIKLCKQNIEELKNEETQLRKFINLAKPANLPDLQPYVAKARNTGKKDGLSENSSVKKSVTVPDEKPCVVEKPNLDEHKRLDDGQEAVEQDKCFGPQKPTESVLQELEKKRKRNRQRTQKPPKKAETSDFGYDEDDFNNCVWKPPEGQTGDGRTSLNEKLGY